MRQRLAWLICRFIAKTDDVLAVKQVIKRMAAEAREERAAGAFPRQTPIVEFENENVRYAHPAACLFNELGQRPTTITAMGFYLGGR